MEELKLNFELLEIPKLCNKIFENTVFYISIKIVFAYVSSGNETRPNAINLKILG